jgi:hypothetical protein
MRMGGDEGGQEGMRPDRPDRRWAVMRAGGKSGIYNTKRRRPAWMPLYSYRKYPKTAGLRDNSI